MPCAYPFIIIVQCSALLLIATLPDAPPPDLLLPLNLVDGQQE